MPDAATVLATPPLRKTWQDAKKKAEDAAKTKEAQKYADLKKKMKGDLGPDLESWPKYYPKWDKLSSEKIKIDGTIKQYSDAVKASTLSDPIKKTMTDALVTIQKSMGDRLKQAEELINSDLKLGLKESAKKQIPPLIIFRQDVANAVASKAGKTALKPESIPLEVILSDDKVIKNVPKDLDDAVLAKEIREKANFQLIIDQLAKLLVSVSANVTSEKDVPAATKKFQEGMDKIIEDCLARAAEPIMKLVGVRSDYRMYKVKQGATLGLAIAGVVGGTIGLAVTPFTGGASTILGIISIVNSSISIGAQLGKLSLSAEQLTTKVAADITTLVKQYEKAKGEAIGAGEMAKSFANATIGPVFTSIKNTKGDCDQVQDKINGLTVQTHDQAQKLGTLLTDQTKLQQEFAAFKQTSQPKLNPEEQKKFAIVDQSLKTSAKAVEGLMKKIETLDARVTKCSVGHKILDGAMNQLAAREPTWAKVGEILITAVVSAGFMVGGNVNVPDAYKCATLVSTINGDLGNVLSSLQSAYSAASDMNDLIKKENEKKKK